MTTAMIGIFSISTFYISLTLAAGWYEFDGAVSMDRQGGYEVSQALPFDLALFNMKILSSTKIWISAHGFISIGSEVKGFEKVTYPLRNPESDPILISPYRSRMDYRPDESSDSEANISYTMNLTEPSIMTIVSHIKDMISIEDDIKDYKGFAVTWDSISFHGGNPSTITYPRNSFQAVIISNGVSSYGIFNYKNIVWDGGHSSGGNSDTGVGANNPPAQAGFNIGTGQGFVSVPYKGAILDIDDVISNNIKGQIIYKLSSKRPEILGCVQLSPDIVPFLQLNPSSGPMAGGNPVTISGLCFTPEQRIQCQFGNVLVAGKYLSASKALCYAPISYSNSRLAFRVFINGQPVRHEETFYFVSIQIPNKIRLSNIDNWRSTDPKESLTFTWDTSIFAEYKGSLVVKLTVYYEDKQTYGWKEDRVLHRGIQNLGSYSFSASDFLCTDKCKEKLIGAVVLELDGSPDPMHPGRLWSDIGPLGWYVKDFLKRTEGDHWPDQLCYDWFLEDNAPSNTGLAWLDELEDCPCMLNQALADRGRFVTDPGCNMFNTQSTNNCYYHKGAQHCVRSAWPSYPTGAGSQCCYDSAGYLMYAGDSTQGSTVDKGHSLGAFPYNRPGLVPSLSHWLFDVITFQYCCLWKTFPETCGIYMDQRPTKDCKNYDAVQLASVFGDPHVYSFNGITHSMSLSGVFTLMKLSSHGRLNMQASFSSIDAESNCSVLSGIALREDNSQLVEILLNRNPHHTLILKATVLVDKKEYNFTHPSLYRQEFQGVTITSWNIRPLTDHSNFTLSLKSGVGVVISVFGRSMNVIVTTPGNLSRMIQTGLLKLSEQACDVNKYSVAASESLFSGQPLKEFPPIMSKDIKQNVDFELARCDGNELCVMDYNRTGDIGLALNTKSHTEAIEVLRKDSQTVLSCGMPVYHGIRNGTRYLVGSETEVIGCRHGYTLEGSKQKHSCLSTGQWSPNVAAKCRFVGFPEFSSKNSAQVPQGKVSTVVLAVVLPVVAVLLITAAVIGYLFYRRRKLKKSGDDFSENPHGIKPEFTYSAKDNGAVFETGGPVVKGPPEGSTGLKSYRIAVDPMNGYLSDGTSTPNSLKRDRFESIASSNQDYRTVSRGSSFSNN